jgi:hypothetical protein
MWHVGYDGKRKKEGKELLKTSTYGTEYHFDRYYACGMDSIGSGPGKAPRLL